MMKRVAIFLVLALLVLMPFTAMASVPDVSCKEGKCSNLKITKVSISPATTKTLPAKIGFAGYISGPVKLVQYTVIDSKTGKIAGSASSYCSRCTKKGICACSCIIKKPGTYDVKVTAYGSGNCCVSMINKKAVTIENIKVSADIVPGFKSKVSGKKVSFKDTTSGLKPAKWTWNFGDGSQSTSQNPTHAYKKAGTYKVCLTVCNTDHDSCKSVCNKVIIK